MKYLLRHIICLLLGAVVVPAWGFTKEDLRFLDQELALKSQYDSLKQVRITMLKSQQKGVSDYDRYLQLFEEYKSYSYDTAFIYADMLLDEAKQIGDEQKIFQAQLKRAFIYLSSGLFHESLSVFANLHPQNMNQANKVEYYTNYARLRYDMADFAHGDISYSYIQHGNRLSEQALALIPVTDTVLYWSTSALYSLKIGDYRHALERFGRALQDSKITEHERAVAFSSMGYIYQLLNMKDEADHYWILAAVADVRSSTKETIAMAAVAERFHERGDLDHASLYIRAAMDDAAFYNARHRQLSVSRIMPIIEEEQVKELEETNQRIKLQQIMLYILLVALILTLVVLANRIAAIHRAHKTIKKMNTGLIEANRIKEEYIGASYRNISDLLSRMEKYQRYVRRTAQEGKMDELQIIPHYVDAHICRKEFDKQFDRSFLRIFPHFIENFNALLRDDEHIEVKEGELLSTELRIFALIRLGISDNEQISKVLDYSINTIYTYKTRVRNRSDLNNNEFLRAIMAIPSFE